MADRIEPFPDSFPNQGRYRRWSASWASDGYADAPQYSGQQPIAFPEDASLIEIQLGGYIREIPQHG